jgi:hypothetical protein
MRTQWTAPPLLHGGRPVDVQADDLADEVDEHQADVRILLEVPEAGHDPVTAVLGIDQVSIVQDLDEAGQPSAEAAVALALGVGGGDKHSS